MLASLAQLKAYMGNINWTPDQANHAETVILPGVQKELEVHCNRPLEVVHIREVRPVDDRGYVVFTVTPVWSINFIKNSITGESLTLPAAPTTPLPAFDSSDTSMRHIDKVGSGPVIGIPYEYPVGPVGASPYWPLLSPYTIGVSPEVTYVCDYTGGWKGLEEEGLTLAILRVAAREVERQFDDTMSIKGGSLDAAESSDPRYKYWDQDELYEWDRLRRRIVV